MHARIDNFDIDICGRRQHAPPCSSGRHLQLLWPLPVPGAMVLLISITASDLHGGQGGGRWDIHEASESTGQHISRFWDVVRWQLAVADYCTLTWY